MGWTKPAPLSMSRREGKWENGGAGELSQTRHALDGPTPRTAGAAARLLKW